MGCSALDVLANGVQISVHVDRHRAHLSLYRSNLQRRGGDVHGSRCDLQITFGRDRDFGGLNRYAVGSNVHRCEVGLQSHRPILARRHMNASVITDDPCLRLHGEGDVICSGSFDGHGYHCSVYSVADGSRLIPGGRFDWRSIAIVFIQTECIECGVPMFMSLGGAQAKLEGPVQAVAIAQQAALDPLGSSGAAAVSLVAVVVGLRPCEAKAVVEAVAFGLAITRSPNLGVSRWRARALWHRGSVVRVARAE